MNQDQLVKQQGGGYQNVYPLTYVQSIVDAESNEKLSDILVKYNHLYLNWQGSQENTRLSIPILIRKHGLWISYDMNGTLYTEWFKGSNITSLIDTIWKDSTNWERIPDLKFVEDASQRIPTGAILPEMLSPALQQLLAKQHNITNLVDDEDLESKCNVIRLKDKEYNPYTASGLGRKRLRKNWVKGRNLLTQEMINQPNVIYEIQYDFDLNGSTIVIPINSTLLFKGGSFSNGKLVCNNTTINNSNSHIFTNVEIVSNYYGNDNVYSNGIICDYISPFWFGAKGDGIADDSSAIQSAMTIAISHKLKFYASGNFRITNNIYLQEYYPKPHLDNRGSGSFEFGGKFIIDNCDGFIITTSGLNFIFDKVISINNGGFIKFLDGGFNTINFIEAYGKGSSRDGIVIAGAYDIGVYGNNLIGYNKNIYCRSSNSSDSFSTPEFNYTALNYGPNNPTIKVLRIGGNFNTVTTDPMSSNYGIYLERVNSAWIDTQIEYVIRTTDSVGIYIDEQSQNINIKTYLESCNKHYIECYGYNCNIYTTIMTTNRALKKDVYIRGFGNVFKRKLLKQKANYFLNNIVAEQAIDISKDNVFEEYLDDSIDSTNPLNRIYSPNDLSRLSGYSPTGGTTPPTIETSIFDQNLSNYGGGFCSKLTSSDSINVYQRSGTFPIAKSGYIYIGCMLKAAGSDIRVMLKASNNGVTEFCQTVVVDGTGWNKIELVIKADYDSMQKKEIDFSISYRIPNNSSLYVANIYGIEGKPIVKTFSNYTNDRPLSLGVNNSVSNIGILSREKKQSLVIGANSDIILEDLEAPIYILSDCTEVRTLKLPKITSNNTYKTVVTFSTKRKESSGHWRLECYTGDKFSNGNQYFNLSKYGGSVTLYAFSNVWYIVENSVIWGGEENPSAVASYEGAIFYNDVLKKNLLYKNNAWVNIDGTTLNNRNTTLLRPTDNLEIGFIFKDVTLNKLILWDGEKWINLDGTTLT